MFTAQEAEAETEAKKDEMRQVTSIVSNTGP